MIFANIICIALMCTAAVSAQEIDLDGLATTLSQQDIPVRQPPSQFKFNKDRTPATIFKRIIGGGVATPHEYPYQVALYVYVYVTLYFCGATLIAPQWVLTAAHCVEYSTSILVILGSHDLTDAEGSRVVYNATTYFIHADWDSTTIQYDIALIKLPQAVTLNSYISTVPIAYGTDTYTGLMSRCLGWGVTILGSLSSVLRYVDAEVITNENCSSYEDYEPYIVDHHLCASGDGIVGSCNGDSGGPLLINGTQIGIVSFGATDCSAGLPSVYTRLTEFYDWVNQTIENNNNSTDDNTDTTGNAHKIESISSILLGVVLGVLMTHFL